MEKNKEKDPKTESNNDWRHPEKNKQWQQEGATQEEEIEFDSPKADESDAVDSE